MKTKQKIISCALVGSIIASSFLALILNDNKPFLSVFSNPKDDATLTLDVSNRVTGLEWGDTTRTYQNGFTTISYYNSNSNEDFHVQLGASGYLFKQEASNTIKSIRVIKENKGILLIESDYVPTFDSNARYEEWFTGTDETFNVVGNYWRIRNVTGDDFTSVCISSITVEYDCYDEDYQSADPNASISGWIDFDTRYVVQEVDGTTYFSLRGYSAYHLLPSQLYIKDDGGTIMNCSFIRYRRDSRFEAFFDLDAFYVNNPSYNGEFVVHLYVNNHGWDGKTGDLYGRYDENNSSVPAATPAGSAQLINASWDQTWGDGHNHPAALVFKNNMPHATSARLEDTGNGIDLVITGIGVNSTKLNNLIFDVEQKDNWGTKFVFDTNKGLTRSMDSTGVWTMRADISSVPFYAKGHVIHLRIDSDWVSQDLDLTNYQLPNFETSYAGPFKLAKVDWGWGRVVVSLYTGYEYETWWESPDWIFNDQYNVVCWAWGTGISDAWYDTIYIDSKHVRIMLPKEVTGFLLVRFPHGTTAENANWNNKERQSSDILISSGTWSYGCSWPQ